MERWYSKFLRGDVWYLHLDTERGDRIRNSSDERKSRPYLIVSCEENNLNAPTFNVIPITTRNRDHLPMHVFFVYQDGTSNGRNQMVLCEQITTVSVQAFENPKSHFMYSFKAEFMSKVDDALARQLGLKPRVVDMTVLEKLVNDIAVQKEKEIAAQKEKEVSMRVQKLAELLAKKFNINLTTGEMLNGTEYRPEELQLADKSTVGEMRDTAEERRKAPIPEEKPKSEKATPAPAASTPQSSEPRKKRTRWTEEGKRAFLEDYGKMSISKMADKYGIKKASVSWNVCLFKKELAEE